MKLEYTETRIDGRKWYSCVAEERRSGFLGSTLYRGESAVHPTKGMAKAEAIKRMQVVLA